MDQSDRQFWQIIRSFIIRYQEYNREKGMSALQIEQSQQSYAKMLCNRELKDVVINRMTAIELKSDYHNLIMLTLLQDLSKWSLEYYESLKDHTGPLECILSQSILILNSQQQFHTIVPKQNQLISTLLSHPYTLSSMESFKILYRKLKDIKEFYPSTLRQHQKNCFLKSIEQCIQMACTLKNAKIIEFIFNNIFNELYHLQETHEYVSQRLKIIKQVVKKLWYFHQDILLKISYLIMKYSYQITYNRNLFNYVIPIYEALIDKFITKDSITPLIIFKHFVISNVDKILKEGANFIILQTLLCQICNIFSNRQYLKYFMRNYDWNYMELPICQESLELLYSYIENRANEKKIQFELIKTYMNRIHGNIKEYLQGAKKIEKDGGVWKFYEIKKKEYFEVLEEMNEKPKKIFKKIESLGDSSLKETMILKYVKLIKKSAQLKYKSMIDLFSTDNRISAQMFAQYVQILLKQCKEHNLQEFMRLFTSNFFLTGESQQIARVMDTITQLYFKHQEESKRIIKSSDSTYTFANAILILNTDLHNPKNEEKMSEDNFIKMCKKINQGQDLPQDVIKKTYFNIKNNKINTFRDRGNMIGISVSNWINICTDYETLNLAYYDEELKELDEKCLNFFIYDMLSSIIDEKETSKLELLVQRFVYDDKIFECEIIEILRKVLDKRSHLPLHILQKIMELANFKNTKAHEKVLSYYWLGANIIQTFSNYIPTNLICQFLVFTWSLRIDLQDNMYLREAAEIRRIKYSIKFIEKRQSKKSIMNMFSSFLSFKESDEETEVLPNEINKKQNFKSISNNIFDLLKHSETHRQKAIQFLIIYIHNEESKLYEEFVSCLFLTFNLLYSTANCEKHAEDLFYELLGVKESSITKRLSILNKTNSKIYNILINYCKFWILKLLLKEYNLAKLEPRENNNYLYLLQKSVDYLQKIDKEILIDLVKELIGKEKIDSFIFESFDKSIKKVIPNKAGQEIQLFYAKFQKVSQESIKVQQKINQNVPQIKNIQKKISQKTEEQIKKDQQIQKPQQKSSQILKQTTESKAQIQVESKQQAKAQDITEKKQQKSDETILIKQSSLKPLQSYINPDQIINSIENQIQEHSKHKSNLHPVEKEDKEVIVKVEIAQKGQAEQTAQKGQKVQIVQREQGQVTEINKQIPASQQAANDDSKEEQSASMPVVIF